MDPGTKKILGMAFFVLLLVGPALIIFQLYEGMTSSNDPKWPTVNGTIIKSEVVQGTRHSSGRSHSIYVPTIIYKYSVDSIEFEGNKVGVVVDESNAGRTAKSHNILLGEALSSIITLTTIQMPI